MNPILAFWHRTRKTFVPLTLPEWERRAPKLTQMDRGRLQASGLVTSEITADGSIRIYELTAEGKEAARSAQERAGKRPLTFSA